MECTCGSAWIVTHLTRHCLPALAILAVMLASCAHAQTQPSVPPDVGAYDYAFIRCDTWHTGHASRSAAEDAGADYYYNDGCGASISERRPWATSTEPASGICGGYPTRPSYFLGIESRNYASDEVTYYADPPDCEVGPNKDGMSLRRVRDVSCPPGWHPNSTTELCDPPTIDPNKNNDACPAGCNGSDPINSATGVVLEKETDYTNNNSPLQFARYYTSSHDQYNPTMLGPQWRDNYDRRITLVTSGAVVVATVYRANGNRLHFVMDASGKFQPDADVALKLDRQIDANGKTIQWILTDEDGTEEMYSPEGRLVSMQYLDQRSLKFSYTGNYLSEVADRHGRSLIFTYGDVPIGSTTEKRLVDIQTPGVATIHYTYDPTDGILSRVDYGSTDDNKVASKDYIYGEDGAPGYAMTGINDEADVRSSSWRYFSDGRARLSVSGPLTSSTNRVELSYPSPDVAVIKNWLNPGTEADVVRKYHFIVKYGVALLSSIECVACSVSGNVAVAGMRNLPKAELYDDNGYTSSTTDWNGTTTTHTYSDGLEQSIIEAAGTEAQRQITTRWNTTFREPIERKTYSADGAEVARSLWKYNGRGQVVARCKVDPAVPDAASYSCGAATTAPAGVRQTVFSYCEPAGVDSGACPLVGLLLSTNGPRKPAAPGMGGLDDVTAYSYYMTDARGCKKGRLCTHRRGDLRKIENALGAATTYLEYDGDGRAIRVRDPNGTITELSWSPRGWLTDRIVRADISGWPDANDAITHIDYDAVGDVTRVTQPDGSYLAYTYDSAHRLIMIGDNIGDSIDYCPSGPSSTECLDAVGNRRVEEVKDPSGAIKRSVHRVYDELSRLQTTLNAAQEPVFDATDGYDGNGNLTQSLDGRGVVTQQRYDSLNRLIAVIQDVGGTDPGTANVTTDYGYDVMDHLRTVKDPSDLATSYTYDGLGNLTELDSPDTGATIYAYDAAGNRTSETDARGVVTSYVYDALNRLAATHYPDSTLDVTYAYGQPNSVTGCVASYPKGRLTHVTDSTGSTTWCYDRRGNPIEKIVTFDGYTIDMHYTYDLADHLEGIDYGTGGSSITYGRDPAGRIDTVGASRDGVATPLVTNIDYLPFGPATSYTFASGATLDKTYDNDYQISDVVGSVAATGDALNLHFATDSMGNITAMGAQAGVPVTSEAYGYDAMSRLTIVTAASSQVQRSFTYSPTGDRLSDAVVGQAPTLYGYAPQTHHLVEVGGGIRTVDAAGYTTTRGTSTLRYNDAGRLEDVSGALNFEYNALGQRVGVAPDKSLGSRYMTVIGVQTATGARYFTYLEDGRLAAEYKEVKLCIPSNTDPCAQPRVVAYNIGGSTELQLVRQYVWAGSTLVAVLVPNPNEAMAGDTVSTNYMQDPGTGWYDVFTDHLGTPRALVGPEGAVVWRWPWAGNAFGEAPAQEDPDGNGVPFTFNVRYPGQYYDAETGLHYNYYRDYDPLTGRYIEADALGLAGNISLYAYAGGNTFSLVDPNGAKPKMGGSRLHEWLQKVPFSICSWWPAYCIKKTFICLKAVCTRRDCHGDIWKEVITNWVPRRPTAKQVRKLDKNCRCVLSTVEPY